MTTNHTELCEKLRQASIQCSDCGMYETSSDFDLAVSMIESQAARIAELEKDCEALIHDNARLLKALERRQRSLVKHLQSGMR